MLHCKGIDFNLHIIQTFGVILYIPVFVFELSLQLIGCLKILIRVVLINQETQKHILTRFVIFWYFQRIGQKMERLDVHAITVK